MSFEGFLADMGERPNGRTLDRINNDGNYEPGNCRWATEEEQRANTRTSRYVEAFGRRLTVAEWARATGIRQVTILARLTRGWTSERALSVDPTAYLASHGRLSANKHHAASR